MSKNVILADCDTKEIEDFKEGLENATGRKYEVLSAISNMQHGSAIKTLKRYLSYFSFPLRIFLNKSKYDTVVGWQQFHALNFAFYCRLFGVKLTPKVVAVNFTYKDKAGFTGRIYKKYMAYILGSGIVRLIHVPSNKYATNICKMFGLDKSSILVTRFGTPDNYAEWSRLECGQNDFVLSIGRSNRNFDWLAEVWNQGCLADKRLIIISDTWQPKAPLPVNVLHIDDVKGDASHPFIAACDMSIVPIDNSELCSGDTVLLNSMMMKKPVAVTTPSTLAEMYVEDGVNGLHLPKEVSIAAQIIADTLNNRERFRQLSESARASYLQNFSRKSMGFAIGKAIMD